MGAVGIAAAVYFIAAPRGGNLLADGAICVTAVALRRARIAGKLHFTVIWRVVFIEVPLVKKASN